MTQITFTFFFLTNSHGRVSGYAAFFYLKKRKMYSCCLFLTRITIFGYKRQKHTINWTVPKDTQRSGQEVMRLMGNAVYLLRTTCTTQIWGTNTVPSLLSSSLRFSSHIVYEWLVCFSILNAENPGGPFTPTSASTRHILHCHRLIMPSETDIDINRYSQCSLWYKPHGWGATKSILNPFFYTLSAHLCANIHTHMYFCTPAPQCRAVRLMCLCIQYVSMCVGGCTSWHMLMYTCGCVLSLYVCVCEMSLAVSIESWEATQLIGRALRQLSSVLPLFSSAVMKIQEERKG